jgi:hypothetical protein
LPRILLIAATTGYQTRSFAEAAGKLGVDLVLATDRCHILEDPWRDHAIAIRFEEPYESAASVAAALEGTRIDGIAAVADRPTFIAALIAEKTGVSWHPPGAAGICGNKHRMRGAFADAGLPAPAHRRVPTEGGPNTAPLGIGYPCVLKPLGLSTSRGVIRADNPREFAAARVRIGALLEKLSRQEREIQVEQYIPGREFALEGLMTHGALRPIALFDKPDPLEGPFFEETIYVTPSRQSAALQREIFKTTEKAVAALGLHHGPVHAEMRVNESGVYMLEIAPRSIGGLCSRALRFRASGRSGTLTIEDLVILHAIGDLPEQLTPATPASGVMMMPVPRGGIFERATGIDEARSVPGVDDVIITAKPGERLTPLPEGASYPGFIFASGIDAAFVETTLRRAYSAIGFHVLGALDVIP